jgi:hypothetical protein
MSNQHGFLSSMFGTTVFGDILRHSVDTAVSVMPDNNVALGISVVFGLLAGAAAGYGTSQFTHEHLFSSADQGENTVKAPKLHQ